jgi:hypothetical protein
MTTDHDVPIPRPNTPELCLNLRHEEHRAHGKPDARSTPQPVCEKLHTVVTTSLVAMGIADMARLGAGSARVVMRKLEGRSSLAPDLVAATRGLLVK